MASLIRFSGTCDFANHATVEAEEMNDRGSAGP